MFWKKKKEYGNCRMCGERKHRSEVKKVDLTPQMIHFEKMFTYWCFDCIKAQEILIKKCDEYYFKKEDKERKAWIKERDKLLKDN